eukprot:65166-Ditylum_brightwellii.AAC.1
MTVESLNRPESVLEMVQCLCVETSDKYVSKPSEFWRLKWIKESLAKGKKLSIKEGKDDLEEVDEDDDDTAVDEVDFEGLGTGLRPVERMKHAPKGSEDLKHFLHMLETTLLEKVKDHTPLPKSRKDKEFNDLFTELQKESK